VEGAIVRGHGQGGESDCCAEDSAALVEHALFNHLVCPQHQRVRNRQAERFRGPHVDDQLKLGRLLDREITWLRSLENLIHVAGSPAEHVDEVGGIHDQPASLDEWRPSVDRWEPMPRHKAHDLLSMHPEDLFSEHQKGTSFLLGRSGKGCFQVCEISHSKRKW
jgi:hypothetical protein